MPAKKSTPKTKDKTAAVIHKLMLRNLQDRLEAGEKLSEAEIARLEEHLAPKTKTKKPTNNPDDYWANRAEAAAELNVSPQTISNWCEEAGTTANRKAIRKATIYHWLWQRAEEKAQTTNTEADDREQQQRIALQQAKIDKATGRLNDEANARALKVCAKIVQELYNDWTNNLPVELTNAEAELQSQNATDKQVAFNRVIKNHLGKQINKLKIDAEPLPETQTEITAITNPDQEN